MKIGKVCIAVLIVIICTSSNFARVPGWFHNNSESNGQRAYGVGNSIAEALLDGLINLELKLDSESFRRLQGRSMAVRSFGDVNLSLAINKSIKNTRSGKTIHIKEINAQLTYSNEEDRFNLELTSLHVDDEISKIESDKNFSYTQKGLTQFDLMEALEDWGLEIKIDVQHEAVYVMLSHEN